MLPLVGGIVGLFVMSINKQQRQEQYKRQKTKLSFSAFFILAYNSYIPYIRSDKDEKSRTIIFSPISD